MEFELFCYAAMTIAIILLRHEPLTPATVSAVELPIELPIELPVELPIELPVVIELVKPKYKRPAAKSSYLAACIIPVDSIAPTLPQGWDLDRNGNPLRGAALKGRKRKLGYQ